MGRLFGIADNTREDSLATRARRKRFAFFLSLLSSVKRPCRILDVGGTQDFWKRMGVSPEADGLELVLLNVRHAKVSMPGISSEIGDARDMRQYSDGAFDVVFSNSVIEHVGTFEDQRRMADEVRRVGRRYFVQTPNRYFPVEPHFLFPMFQFLPIWTRVFLVRRIKLGWKGRIPDPAEARREVEAIRLLSHAEVRRLFPGADIYRERLGGLVKSFVAYGGWDTAEPAGN